MISTTTSPCPVCTGDKSLDGISFCVYNTADAVAPLQWNQLVPGANKLMQIEQLALVEQCHKGEMDFRYVFVKKKQTNIGVIYFQVVRFTGNDLLNYFPDEPKGGITKRLYKLVRGISENLVKKVDVKLLVTGNVFMTGENGFYFQHDISKSERGGILRKAIKQVAATDAQIRAVLISDLYEPKTEFDKNFAQHGYHEITVEADMSIALHNNWKDLNGYLESLSSKYRVRARKVFNMCAANGVVHKELNADDVKQYSNDLYNLYMMVMGRVDFKLASLDKSFFAAQKQQLPNNYHIYAYFKEGEMIGFISFYHFGRRMEVHYTGMDAEKCKPIHLYQHMLYDMIGFGIEHRMERLHFGRTAPEIKSTVGAAPSP
ncbi:MAG TPA: GNAT family N-acetyltransferase, partial [Chitinophagales bacterium]|nr:GNAT family N-acetyltransferase [Chitinophagales bacterium]